MLPARLHRAGERSGSRRRFAVPVKSFAAAMQAASISPRLRRFRPRRRLHAMPHRARVCAGGDCTGEESRRPTAAPDWKLPRRRAVATPAASSFHRRRRRNRSTRKWNPSRARSSRRKNFCASWWTNASRWEMGGGEMRLFFPTEEPRARRDVAAARSHGTFAQRCRLACSAARCASVLNWRRYRRLRQHVRPTERAELRAKFEQDPIVRAMMERFGGQISDVKRRGEE